MVLLHGRKHSAPSGPAAGSDLILSWRVGTADPSRTRSDQHDGTSKLRCSRYGRPRTWRMERMVMIHEHSAAS